MGKKRKGSGSQPGNELIKSEQTRYSINEKFADSEDEFFAGRDQILLDGPANKRRKVHKDDEFLQPSDEEVLGYDEDGLSADGDLENENVESDGDKSLSNKDEDDEDEDNLRNWGTSKADYYNADVIETQADALEEEKEALRLHQKHLQNLTEADFGLDESQWTKEDATGVEVGKGNFIERLPDLEINEDASSEEKAQILESRYPEFQPLANDFVELQKVHEDLSLAAQAAEAVVKMKPFPGKNKTRTIMEDVLEHKTPIATIKLRALSAYLGTIGMYFALLTSTTKSASSYAIAMPPAELRDHPIVQSLLHSKRLWEEIKDTPIPELQEVAIEAETDNLVGASPESKVNGTSTLTAMNGGVAAKKRRRTQAERAALQAQESAQAERKVRMQKTEAKLAHLDALVSMKRKGAELRPSATVAGAGSDSDFGDEEALTAQEAAEKAHRKKSLRFYTSQIAQKSNKRGAASRDAGGDADLPYKERLKDRQARLMREAERRGQSQAGEDELLDDKGSGDDAEEMRLAKDVRGDDLDEDGYYDMISARTKEKKHERKALAEAQARAAKEGGHVYIEEEVGPDGKRAISYAIAKNKGLAPRRKKEVRNPRVKKKIQYSQKLKKLSSIRQVYKGGEGRGGYGGELTGIKTNVLKGVKL